MTVISVRGPQPVFCVHERARRDRHTADELLSGRVTAAGVTVDVGLTPDWTTNPHPPDGEWRADWVKFYYGLDLAHAFGETRDARYLHCWERLLESYIDRQPPGADATEVVARRITNWIYAWNRFEASEREGVSPGLAARVIDFLWQEVTFVRDHLSTERNHRTLELYGLLVAAVAFPDRDAQHALRAEAFAGLVANLLDDVRPDGVHRESSTHYHCIALRSWLGALAIARQCGVDLGAAFHERLQEACEFAALVHRPDGRIPACSDADSESHLDVIALAAALFDRTDWRWIATGGAVGRAPARVLASFVDAGYYVQRSGWGTHDERFADARYLVFDCGPLGDGGHGHYDLLNVEVYAGGRPLIVDPGRYTYSEAGDRNWRHWFKSTAAHNTVTVDGFDQTPYARRKPKGPIAEGRLLLRSSSSDLDMLVGEARSALYDAVHTRTVLFVAREYWVIVDHLAAPTAHRYELRWHLSPEASAAVSVDDGGTRVHGHGVTLATAQGRVMRLEDGWYAPRYGVRQPAAVVVSEARARTVTFVTVVQPVADRSCEARASVGFQSVGERLADRGIVQINGVGPSGRDADLLTWSLQRDFIEVAGFRGVARAAWVRRGADFEPTSFAAVDVTECEEAS